MTNREKQLRITSGTVSAMHDVVDGLMKNERNEKRVCLAVWFVGS